MTASYLERCRDLFDETMETRYGWRPDYAGLERALDPVRSGARAFAFRDLETIQNGRYWDFRQFWRFPAESDIEQEIDMAEMARLIARLPLDETSSIGRLHAGLKFIENVSVVLRFVHPDQYGILSPPVEKLLEVRRGNTEVETYVNYLRDIREIRDHHGMRRAADVDMALWVLQERVLSSYRDHDLLRAFRSDTWLLRRKAVNLLADLAEVDDTLELARALLEVHLPLSGMMAGFELERRLRAKHGSSSGLPLAEVIDALAGSGVDPAAVAEWRRAARVRDRFLETGERPARQEALALIEVAGALTDANSRGR